LEIRYKALAKQNCGHANTTQTFVLQKLRQRKRLINGKTQRFFRGKELQMSNFKRSGDYNSETEDLKRPVLTKQCNFFDFGVRKMGQLIK
jgi:hypothetical protein